MLVKSVLFGIFATVFKEQIAGENVSQLLAAGKVLLAV